MEVNKMGFEKDIKELEKIGLFSREAALGKEAHNHLLKLEGRAGAVKKGEIRKKMICVYCGAKAVANPERFKALHKCEKPMIFELKDWPMPTRPIKVEFFKVIYNGKAYRFADYMSAMKFRRQLWIKEIPLKVVLLDETLKWY